MMKGQKPWDELVGREDKEIKTENANSSFKMLGWKEEERKGNRWKGLQVKVGEMFAGFAD